MNDDERATERAPKGIKKRGAERSEAENPSLAAFSLKLTTWKETATKQSHTLPQRNNKQQLERAGEKLHEKERREGKDCEMDRES